MRISDKVRLGILIFVGDVAILSNLSFFARNSKNLKFRFRYGKADKGICVCYEDNQGKQCEGFINSNDHPRSTEIRFGMVMLFGGTVFFGGFLLIIGVCVVRSKRKKRRRLARKKANNPNHVDDIFDEFSDDSDDGRAKQNKDAPDRLGRPSESARLLPSTTH